MKFGIFLLMQSPDMLPSAEKIHRLTQATGMSYLNCTFALGQIPQQKVLKSMELFATRVMPHFRDYTPDQSKYPERE